MERNSGSDDVNTFLTWAMNYQVLSLYSVVEPVIIGDPEWTELHRKHVDYVQNARNGGEVDPAYEAELIIRKSAREDEIGPMAIAA